ncbi:MAG: 3'-5' exonuclease DinG [Chlamydiia bacterium]|nr:3'-5' exonuclease DinG [Chlamydiia bacterium]
MSVYKNETFVCFDVESTGLDIQNDRIIEIAIVKFKGDEILDSYETLIDPGVPIPAESIEIHKITPDMVAGKPAITEVFSDILKLLANSIIVGHNIKYDIGILLAEAARHNIPNKLDKLEAIDTLRLARLYGESKNNSLQALREHFDIPIESAHRAMGDVIVNIKVFKYLIQPFAKLADLRGKLKKPILMSKMPLGKYKGHLMKDLPEAYLRWAKKLDFDEDLSYTIAQELKRRNQTKSFLLKNSPFKDL